MVAPDLPMTPPMRDAWQRSRNAAWPGGTDRGGGGALDRFEDGPFAGAAAAAAAGGRLGLGSGMAADGGRNGRRFAGRAGKLLPMLSRAATRIHEFR